MIKFITRVSLVLLATVLPAAASAGFIFAPTHTLGQPYTASITVLPEPDPMDPSNLVFSTSFVENKGVVEIALAAPGTLGLLGKLLPLTVTTFPLGSNWTTIGYEVFEIVDDFTLASLAPPIENQVNGDTSFDITLDFSLAEQQLLSFSVLGPNGFPVQGDSYLSVAGFYNGGGFNFSDGFGDSGPSTVPESGTAGLMLAGLLAFGWVRSSRKKAA